MAILANEGLLRYCVPAEYGGVGVRVMDLCIIREELARVSVQADTNFIMQGLGSYPITLGGTDEQKARYLPPIARAKPCRGSLLWLQSPIEKPNDLRPQVDVIVKGVHVAGMTLLGFANKAIISTTTYIRFAECAATAY